MRRQPVAFALIDAAFLADSKWRALRRRLSEPRDFNSAVGAWLIVLTAARRNGLPDVDSGEEAEDPTFIPDLVSVGLLTETGIPDKPFKAWAPARPRYPSDVAPGAPEVTDAPSSPFPTAGSVSTPFTSTQLPSKKTRPRARGFTDPLLVEMRSAIEATYGNGDTPIVPEPTRILTGAEQERERNRLEAHALHERFKRGELTEDQYERLRADIGKEPDDLTRIGV